MPLFYAQKKIFIWIPKTGGTALVHHFGDWKEGGHHPWTWYRDNYPAEWKSFDKFAVVRDPVARLQSAYFHARTKDGFWFKEHPEYELCTRNSLNDIILNDALWSKLVAPAWVPQVTWTGKPSEVDDIRYWRHLPMVKPMNVSDRSRPEMGELSREALERVLDLYAEDYDEFDFIDPFSPEWQLWYNAHSMGAQEPQERPAPVKAQAFQ